MSMYTTKFMYQKGEDAVFFFHEVEYCFDNFLVGFKNPCQALET